MDKIVLIMSRFWQIILVFWENNPWIIPSLAIAIALAILARKFMISSFSRFIDNLQQSFKVFWLNLLKDLIIEFWIRFTNPLLFKYYDHLRKYFLNQEKSIFITPYLILENAPPENQINQPQKIWYFLAKSQQIPAYRRIAIIASGGGKTKLLEYLLTTYIDNDYLRYQAPNLIPFLLPLRKISSLITPHNSQLPNLIQQFFQQQPSPLQVNFTLDWLEKYLVKGKALILLDGLDEIGKISHRQKVKEWIEQQIINYPHNIFLITSRFYDAEFFPWKQITLLKIKSFDFEQIKQFIINWYSQHPETTSRRKNKRDKTKQNHLTKAESLVEGIIQHQFLAQMARNPLLLELITKIYAVKKELPRNKNELYQKILKVLLSQETTKLRYPMRLSLEHRQELLQLLALELLKQNTLKFTLEEGEVILGNKLAEIVENRLTVANFLELIKLNSGLLKENQGIYEFSHLSFQEYLAAIHLKNTGEEALILNKISHPFWRETIIFYSGQSDVTAIVNQALKINSFDSLTLAHQCLQVSPSVAENSKIIFDSYLKNVLQSSNTNLIKLAGEIQLQRRLNRLRNESHLQKNIDSSLITCAEYQLFINYQHQLEKNRQPDHWNNSQFFPGQGQENITGIRASDAKEFCEWLTEWSEEIGFKYRIPTLAEAEESPLLDHSIGYWCEDGQEMIITGINEQQWSILNQQITDLIKADPVSSIIENRTKHLDFAQILGHKLDLDLALNTARDTARNLTTELGQDPLLNRSLEAVITQSYTQALVNRNLSFNYIKNLARTLESALQLSPNITLDLSAIGSYLLLVSGFWYRLASFYQDSLTSVRKLRDRKLNRKTCQDLVKKFTQKGDEAFNLYVFFLLIEERRAGRISAWESIRIVREKI